MHVARYIWYALIIIYARYSGFTEDLRNEKSIYAWYAGTDFIYAWYSGTDFIYASYEDIILFMHDTHYLRRIHAWYLDCVNPNSMYAWCAWYASYKPISLLMAGACCRKLMVGVGGGGGGGELEGVTHCAWSPRAATHCYANSGSGSPPPPLFLGLRSKQSNLGKQSKNWF